MTRIYLIRHAETEEGGPDPALWPLSERGEEQVRVLAAQPFWSEIQAVVSSDEPKALATVAGIAAERGIPLFKHESLRELKRTRGRVDDYDERVRQVFARPAQSVEGWERATDAQARILACMDELIGRFDPQPFAVVSHGMVLALLLASVQNALGQTFEIWKQLGFASVVSMER